MQIEYNGLKIAFLKTRKEWRVNAKKPVQHCVFKFQSQLAQ